MTAFYPKPPLVRPKWGHFILRAQTLWLVANDKSRAPGDILHGAYAAFSLGSGVSYGSSCYGSAFVCDGSATGFINLGSTNRFLASDTTPCTVSWVEQHTGAATNGGVIGLFPTSAAKQFIVLRANDNSIDSGHYGILACGPWTTSGILPSFLMPGATPNANILQNSATVFVLTGLAGTASQTASNWKAWWSGGGGSGRLVSSGGGNTANLGATANYFGWDNADNKWTGALDNLRVWNRVLSEREIQALLQDPYLGCARAASIATMVVGSGGGGGGASSQSQMFLAA